MSTKKLSTGALRALGQMEVIADEHGAQVIIGGGQLDRKVYVEVNTVLEQLGGKWSRKAKAHLFVGKAAEDLEDQIEAIFLAGEYTDWRKLRQFYETPPELAKQLVKMAVIMPGHRVLEPSAGRGRIIRALRESGTQMHVTAVELDPENVRDHLQGDRWNDTGCDDTFQADFLDWRPEPNYKRVGNTGLQAHTDEHLFDRVVMNPPFTRQQDALHVRHAYDLVRSGGRVVAIMSAAVKFRDTAAYRWVRDHAALIQDNKPGSFMSESTNVNTVTVVLEKE